MGILLMLLGIISVLISLVLSVISLIKGASISLNIVFLVVGMALIHIGRKIQRKGRE